jgi:hypothetical protein
MSAAMCTCIYIYNVMCECVCSYLNTYVSSVIDIRSCVNARYANVRKLLDLVTK